jgi:hypothetical protein
MVRIVGAGGFSAVRNPTHPVSDSDNIRSRATVIRSPRDVAAERGLLMSPWTGSVKRFDPPNATVVGSVDASRLIQQCNFGGDALGAGVCDWRFA